MRSHKSTNQKATKSLERKIFKINDFTFHGPCQRDGIEHGMQRDAHSKLEQVWTRNEYISRTCGTIDK